MPASARSPLRAAALVALSLVTSGCMQVRYLAQAAHGQLELSAHARPLDRALRDPEVPPRTRALLAEVPTIKSFGERQGLTRTGSYRTFVDLDRSVAVWVVTACEPLRFRSLTWRFPIVGPVPYLGWFHRQAALRFAARLRHAGWDVDVRPAAAYSTLGWFRDPVLSTMIRDGDEALGRLVNIVLHESMHATVFVKGQTHFNESVASFAADRLAVAYLVETRGERAPETLAYRDFLARLDALDRAYGAAYRRLAKLYAASLPSARKRAVKARLLADLEADTQSTTINNAALMEYRAYGSGVAEMEALLAACGGDWGCFLGAVRSVSGAAFTRPNQDDLAPVLGPLAARARRRPPPPRPGSATSARRP